MTFASRPPLPFAVRMIAAVHLSPHANEASTTLIQCWARVYGYNNMAGDLCTGFGLLGSDHVPIYVTL